MLVSRALSAVDYPKASSSALACYKWLQGTAGGVGESSGIDRLTDVPGFRRVRHRRKSFAQVREAEFYELRIDLILRRSGVKRCRKFPCYTYRTLENSSTVKPASLIRALSSPRFNSV